LSESQWTRGVTSMSKQTTADILYLLQRGTIELEGLLPWSSNYTFLIRICGQPADTYAGEVQAVYKPRRGERPLWDFAQGTLCQRERAAFLVSQALGWSLVPPTVIRKGPHGQGSIQLFVEHDPERHYFTLEGDATHQRQLQQIALLDVVINNADRKGGHVLLEASSETNGSERLWAIDHGICFHTEHKLRTVIWEFAGELIPGDLLADLVRLKEQFCGETQTLTTQLKDLLTGAEVAALQKRLERLIKQGRFLSPGPGRHYPWPPV